MIVSSRSIREALTSHHHATHASLLEAAAASVISGPGATKPPPAAVPIATNTGAFPQSTWHADLPDPKMPSLEEWQCEGLSSDAVRRIQNVISVYSLGFHQLIRAVRAGMASPSSTVANLWKMFVFLLNDCMPDGSVYAMRIASMERSQSERARELVQQRETELSRLLRLEGELQAQVRALDQQLRLVQAHRQEVEDARLEALDTIEQQETLQASAAEEIADLHATEQKWQQRFQLANNRHKMLQEDYRQLRIAQEGLKVRNYSLSNELTAAEKQEANVNAQFETLTAAFEALQDRYKKAQFRQGEANQACARSSAESQDISWKLIQLGGRVGQLTVQALTKIKERILVVKQVEAIQEELNNVVNMELAESATVTNMSEQRESIQEQVESLCASKSQLHQKMEDLKVEIESMEAKQKEVQEKIAMETKKLEATQKEYDRKIANSSNLEGDLAALQTELEVDDGHIANAEKRLAAAMAAVQALNEIVRNTRNENKSLLREVRVLDTHREQLSEDIATHTTNIEQHESIVAARIEALKQDIKQHEDEIVESASLSRKFQEDAVTFKQDQLDLAAKIETAEVDLESTSLALTEQNLHLNVATVAARESTEKRNKVRAELERVNEIRAKGREALEAKQKAHAERMEKLQAQLKELQDAAQTQQQSMTQSRQAMSNLAQDRKQMESEHDSALLTLLQDSKSLDIDLQHALDRHQEWIDDTAEEQVALQHKLRHMQEQLQMTNQTTGSLNQTLAASVAKRQTEKEKALQMEAVVAKKRALNQQNKALEASLNEELTRAQNRLANRIYDNQTIQHLLNYTLQTNSALEERKKQYENIARQQSTTVAAEIQTEGEWRG